MLHPEILSSFLWVRNLGKVPNLLGSLVSSKSRIGQNDLESTFKLKILLTFGEVQSLLLVDLHQPHPHTSAPGKVKWQRPDKVLGKLWAGMQPGNSRH